MSRKRRDKDKDKDKEQKRFYLLPGQGGRLYRQKQKRILGWSIAAAIFASALLAVIMYFMNRSGTLGAH